MGAKLASKVALATDVAWIDQCQKARSPAKAKPDRPSSHQSLTRRGRRAAGPRRRFSLASHSHNAGTAKPTRQNAVADGPSSDRRTKIGENAMAVAPANSAINAQCSVRRRCAVVAL